MTMATAVNSKIENLRKNADTIIDSMHVPEDLFERTSSEVAAFGKKITGYIAKHPIRSVIAVFAVGVIIAKILQRQGSSAKN